MPAEDRARSQVLQWSKGRPSEDTYPFSKIGVRGPIILHHGLWVISIHPFGCGYDDQLESEGCHIPLVLGPKGYSLFNYY
jgi:hypothetical protein